MPRTPPKPLSTGRYIAAVAGLCVLGVVLAAFSKNNARDLLGGYGLWIGWAVVTAVYTAALVLFARRVGNPTAWVICGVFFGMAFKPLGEELGKLATGPDGWGPKTGETVAFFLGYLFWAFVIHWRVAGVPNPVPAVWGGAARAGTGSADSRSHSSTPVGGGTPP